MYNASCAVEKLTHIMISYQWDVQEEVLKIRQRLKAAGYRVWIDVEQMCKFNKYFSCANILFNPYKC